MIPRASLRKSLADKKLLGGTLAGSSWASWKALLLASMGEKLTDEERKLFKKLTRRDKEPGQRVQELVVVAGRRAGKSRAISTLVSYLATLCNYPSLAPGETGVVLCLAPDRRQASVLLSYIAATIRGSPMLSQLLVN